MQTDTRHYQIGGREASVTLNALRTLLSAQMHLNREFSLSQKSGGRDGDLGEESMEQELYVSGSCNGSTGAVCVYSVIDDGANGYAHCLSVIVRLPKDLPKLSLLETFLRDAEFANTFKYFKERPYGFKHYRSFVDDTAMPNLELYRFPARAASKAA